MASIAELLNAQALGEQPKLRVVSSENPPAVRNPLDILQPEPVCKRKLLIYWRPRPKLHDRL
jgi:hypothetical protein